MGWFLENVPGLLILYETVVCLPDYLGCQGSECMLTDACLDSWHKVDRLLVTWCIHGCCVRLRTSYSGMKCGSLLECGQISCICGIGPLLQEFLKVLMTDKPHQNPRLM